eukprot:gene15326-15471_t
MTELPSATITDRQRYGSRYVSAQRRNLGRSLVVLACLSMIAMVIAQSAQVAGWAQFGFVNWRPSLYAYLAFCCAIMVAQVIIRGEQGQKALFVLPAVMFTVLMVIFPTIFGLFVAFSDWNLSSATGRKLNGLANFWQLLGDSYFWNALLNMGYYVAAVLVQYAIAFGLALLLNADIRARKFFRVAFLTPFMLSPVAVSWMVGKSIMENRFGPAATFARFLGWENPAFFSGATDTVSSFIFREYRDRSNVGYGTMLAEFYFLLIAIFISLLLALSSRIMLTPAAPPRRNLRNILLRVFIYGALLLWTFIALFPIYWTVTTSFKTAVDVTQGHLIPFIDFMPDWRGWRSLGLSPDRIFQTSTARDEFMLRFENSIIMSVGASFIAVVIGSLAAYGLARFEYHFLAWKNKDISFFFLSQLIMPPVVLAMPFLALYKEMALLDTATGLIAIYTLSVLPIVIWIMRHIKLPTRGNILKTGAVTLGVRPEHLQIAKKDEVSSLGGRVTLTEHLGSETMLYVQTQSNLTLLIKTDGLAPQRIGEDVALRLIPEACHIFDSAGDTVLSGSLMA